jgi:hypothetical protein
MRELTVAAGAVRALLEFAVSRGANRERLMERSRLDPAELADRDHQFRSQVRSSDEGGKSFAAMLALHFGPVPSPNLIGGHRAFQTMAEGSLSSNFCAPLTEVKEASDRNRLCVRARRRTGLDHRSCGSN